MTLETIDIKPLILKIEDLSKTKNNVLELLDLHRQVLQAHYNNTGKKSEELEKRIDVLEETFK